MSKKDPLDSEISASAQLTPTGLSAKSRSRFASAVDRLGGNLVDLMNPALERRTALARAKTESEAKIIEALGEQAVARLAADNEFAQRAILQHFSTILDDQCNKDAVVAGAAEQLRLSPPVLDSEQAPETLSDEFLGRFEGYARSASTEDLRLKWSSVLAAEVRKPGTVSNKVMRIVDETPPDTARVFQSFCKNRLGAMVPKHLSGELSFSNRVSLVDAELIVDPGFTGHWKLSEQTNDSLGNQLWFIAFEGHGIALRQLDPNTAFSTVDPNLSIEDMLPRIGVYVLTDAGKSVASVFDYDPRQAVMRLTNALEGLHPGFSAQAYVLVSDGNYQPL